MYILQLLKYTGLELIDAVKYIQFKLLPQSDAQKDKLLALGNIEFIISPSGTIDVVLN